MKQKHILSRLPNTAFVCGANNQNSMRSQFIDYIQSKHKHIFISGRKTKNIFSNERIILAEEAENLWDKSLKAENAGYNNLLEFEMDIVELASVIPIFLESSGAKVETGAFFCKHNLRKKLLIIVKKEHFNNNSFIDRAILKDPSLKGRVLYYDPEKNNELYQKEIFEKIFGFRNQIGHQIDTQKDNPTALYFFLLKFLCKWKTKEEIFKELHRNNELKKYADKIDNHLKILTALGLVIEEPDFSEKKFLSLTREDCVIPVIGLSQRNIDHEINIFNQIGTQIESELILLKYMKKFADEDYFSYSYCKHSTGGYKKPNQQLNVLQKILNTRILNNKIFPIHKSATAYVKGSSIRLNAEQHRKKQFFLKLDFKQFFSSIKRSDFLNYLKTKNQNFNDEYSNFICDIAFRDDSVPHKESSLPIGASTSPSISNILLYLFDEKISEYSRSLGITYTRYADDLTFSHNEPNKLNSIENKIRKLLQKISYPSNLQINNKKTLYMSKKGRRQITGLYITPNGKISIGRNKKNYIKKLLRDYEKGKYQEKKQHIQGYLCFIKSIERELWNRLYNKYKKDDFSKLDELFDDNGPSR